MSSSARRSEKSETLKSRISRLQLFSHHKTELVVECGVEVVLHDFGLELVVGAGHEEDPDIGVHLAWKGLLTSISTKQDDDIYV